MNPRTITHDPARGDGTRSAHAPPTPGPAVLVARAHMLLAAWWTAEPAERPSQADAEALLSMLQQTVRTLPKDASAGERAVLYEALGLCLRDLTVDTGLPSQSPAADALRRAITAFDEARDVAGGARTRASLAELLTWTCGPERPQALREALGLLRVAAERGNPSRNPVLWADLHINLGDLLLDLSPPGPSDEARDALSHYELALGALPSSLLEDRLWVLIALLRCQWRHRGKDLALTTRAMWPHLQEALLLAREPGLARGLVFQIRGEVMLALVGSSQPKALEDALRSLQAAHDDLIGADPSQRAEVVLSLGLAQAAAAQDAAARRQAASTLADALRLPLTSAQTESARAALHALSQA